VVSRVMEVAEGVHRLTNGVANFYLIEESGKLVLVDAGAPKDWALFTQAALALGKVVGDLDAVLLTHAHTDHIGFAEKARTTTGARVWVHEQDAQMARTGKVGPRDRKTGAYLLRGAFWRTALVLGMRGATKIIPVQEVSEFSDGEVLEVPGSPRVVHAPGHTGGSARDLAGRPARPVRRRCAVHAQRLHRAGWATDYAVRAERRHGAGARVVG
jgi:glyoxylase-like metal-dependent hydrolase (beta-lactamase superfamily II)